MAEKSDRSAIGVRIRKARLKKGLSQSELAAAIEKTDQSISKYERGVYEPSAASASALADALGVTTEWIITGKEDSAAKAEEEDKPGWIRFVEDGFLEIYRRKGLSDEQVEYLRVAVFRAGHSRGPERYVELAELLCRDPVESSAEEAMAKAKKRRKKQR